MSQIEFLPILTKHKNSLARVLHCQCYNIDVHGKRENSMKAMPKIQKVMTAMPHTIGSDIPIKQAMEIMRNFHIRHLPVQSGGDLVGVISDRDIQLARSFQGTGELTVDDVMTPDPYVVQPEAELDEVVLNMAEHKYGCAIVRQSNGKVVGILTDNDGLRILGDTLRSHYKAV